MSLRIHLSPVMPTRPCRFSLALQDGSVFADFDVDRERRVYLRSISFDGFGYTEVPPGVDRLPLTESTVLMAAVSRNALETPAVETILRSYFRQVAPAAWPEAFADHDLL